MEQQLKDENILPLSKTSIRVEEGYFTGKENIEIYYKIFKQAELESPAILISSGRTEAAIKYKELIF
jgi:alpha-beta hydrolase superfamily lysophospholipase